MAKFDDDILKVSKKRSIEEALEMFIGSKADLSELEDLNELDKKVLMCKLHNLDDKSKEEFTIIDSKGRERKRIVYTFNDYKITISERGRDYYSIKETKRQIKARLDHVNVAGSDRDEQKVLEDVLNIINGTATQRSWEILEVKYIGNK